MHMSMCIYMCPYTPRCTFSYACLQTYLHADVNVHTHVCTCKYTYVCTHVLHTRIRMCIHMCTQMSRQASIHVARHRPGYPILLCNMANHAIRLPVQSGNPRRTATCSTRPPSELLHPSRRIYRHVQRQLYTQQCRKRD